MTRSLGAVTVAVLLSGWTAAFGDVVVKQKVTADVIALPQRVGGSVAKCAATVKHPAGGEQVTLTLGKDRARRECGDLSVILRRDRRVVYLVYPQDRRFSELKLPVSLKEAGSSMAKSLGPEIMRFRVEIENPAEEAIIGSWRATRRTVRLVNDLRRRLRVTLATAPGLVPDPGLPAELRAVMVILGGAVEDWTALLPVKEGLAVFWEEGEVQPETEFIRREEVVSIEEREVPEGTYDVPEGYVRTPFEPECVRMR